MHKATCTMHANKNRVEILLDLFHIPDKIASISASTTGSKYVVFLACNWIEIPNVESACGV